MVYANFYDILTLFVLTFQPNFQEIKKKFCLLFNCFFFYSIKAGNNRKFILFIHFRASVKQKDHRLRLKKITVILFLI